MILPGKPGWQLRRFSLSLMTGLLALCLLYASDQYLDQSSRHLRAAQASLLETQRQLDALRRLQQEALAARADLADLLAGAPRSTETDWRTPFRHLRDLPLILHHQLESSPPRTQHVDDGMTLQLRDLTLHLDLVHEGGLLAVAESLSVPAGARLLPRGCQVEKPPTIAHAAVQAHCQFRWVTASFNATPAP